MQNDKSIYSGVEERAINSLSNISDTGTSYLQNWAPLK